MTNSHTVEQVAVGCEETQAAPKVHHSNKSSGPGQRCIPSGEHLEVKESIAQVKRNDNPRSTGESIVEDLAVVAQPQLEEVEGISPERSITAEISSPNPEGISPREGEGISPSNAEGIILQQTIETLNVLVNDGST